MSSTFPLRNSAHLWYHASKPHPKPIDFILIAGWFYAQHKDELLPHVLKGCCGNNATYCGIPYLVTTSPAVSDFLFCYKDRQG